MTVEMLSSNVVNYLVWRYLQEAGYGNAALQLSRCWNRDPEILPFAKNVSQHTLINLLQDGLWFDKLQAEAGNGQHRYNFGRDHGRPYSVPNGTLLTLDKGIPAHELAEAANSGIQDPPPRKVPGKKKKGKVNGIDSRMHHQVNGDAMDVDQNGSTHVTNSVRAESEAVASEADSPTVAEIPISTLSIGQSTEIQTEVVADLAPDAIFSSSIKDPDKLVTQTLWGPPETPAFVTAGKSLLRFHIITKEPGVDLPVVSTALNAYMPQSNYAVTSLCWKSDGEVIVSAQEETTNDLGEALKKDKLFKLINGGSGCQHISSEAGLVTTLRWNESKQLLLAISSDGQQGSIKIWKTPGEEDVPTWSSFTENAIYEAIWISDSTFVVCGINMLQIYEINETPTVKHSLETSVTWEKVKYEPTSNILATMGVNGQIFYLGILNLAEPTNFQVHEYPDPYLTDIDFRSIRKTGETADLSNAPDESNPIQLATCAASGVVRVWDANQPFHCLKRLPTTDESQANNIAFSPDGSLLAAAGPDSVTVWDIDKRDRPLATWRAQDTPDNNWDATVDGDFSLGWNPDGTNLSIALGNQIAIIPVSR